MTTPTDLRHHSGSNIDAGTKPATHPSSPTDDLRDWLRLLLTIGMGHEHTHNLLRHFGEPRQIFAAPPSSLRPMVGEARANALQREPKELDKAWESLLAWLQGANNRYALTLADVAYPRAVLALHDAPILLFACGNMPLARLDHGLGLAVVGSRNPTPQGLVHARSFAKYFAEQCLLVVSGLAAGIDAAAHEGALAHASHASPASGINHDDAAAAADVAPQHGVTVAVTGTGLDRVYPKQNHVLAHQISDQGLLLSEFTPGTPPLPHHFPRRNRLIAALSRGCLVVEATRHSGSLITARLCADMGREVYALPGSIHAPQSQGCHHLIKEGARLVESAAEVLEDLFPSSLTPLALAQQKKPLTKATSQSPSVPMSVPVPVPTPGTS